MTQLSKLQNSITMYPIAVVIPAYRSERHIVEVLEGIPPFVTFIIVINDCSPDQTAQLVQSSVDTRVYLVSHDKNQGVGGAVLSGYQKSIELGAEIIVKMDSDGQMEPAYIIPLIAPILTDQADYTKGNRFLHTKELKSMPLIRRLGNAGLSFLTKAASGYWNIFDPTNGYTAIHASVIPALDIKKVHQRYFFESSMLIELGKIRAVVQDVQIPAKYQSEVSSLSEWKALFEFPPRLLNGFLHRILTQYFVRDFGVFSVLLILGLSFSAFGLTFGLYHWYLSYITSTVASTGTVMISVLPLILGSQLLLQSLIVDMQNVPAKPIHININIIKAISEEINRQDNNASSKTK